MHTHAGAPWGALSPGVVLCVRLCCVSGWLSPCRAHRRLSARQVKAFCFPDDPDGLAPPTASSNGRRSGGPAAGTSFTLCAHRGITPSTPPGVDYATFCMSQGTCFPSPSTNTCAPASVARCADTMVGACCRAGFTDAAVRRHTHHSEACLRQPSLLLPAMD
jgi:hypothetical protein|eukprot:COSAG01_NODE_299_length_19246_cov_62.028827_2_plen_162_part_00